MRWVVRFAYDGSQFAGWARQPGLRTVEGEIRRGLERAGILTRGSRAGLDVASRTDRGVSARANALAIASELPGPSLLRLLNGISAEIRFTAASPVEAGFRVRRAVRRVYRYFEPEPVGGMDRWERAAAALVGRIDVRSFGRQIPAAEPCWRTIESISVAPIAGSAIVEVRAPSFVWGEVRKIVGALRTYGAGRLPLSRLEAAVRGRERLSLPLAEAERLVLWEVEYPFRWEVEWRGANRHQAAWARSSRESLWVRSQILEAVGGAA